MYLQEAPSLNLSYKSIRELALIFNNSLCNKEIDIEIILKGLGGKINYVEAKDFEKQGSFLIINGDGDFEVQTLKNDEFLKKLFLTQALGHYMLHSQKGLYPCKISHASKGITAREGLYFSLSLLIDDDLMFKMINKGYNNKQMANMFRVPENFINIKKIAMEINDGYKTN